MHGKFSFPPATPFSMRRRRLLGSAGAMFALAGCAGKPLAGVPADAAFDERARLQWLDRVTWGADETSEEALRRAGLRAWLRGQLHPRPAKLPAEAQRQIDAMAISRQPVDQLVFGLEARRKDAAAITDTAQRTAALQAYQRELASLVRETRQRFALRALYSPDQLHEQMVWFWGNHFNVSVRKGATRALVADYEESAIRPYALGRFRELLGHTLRHPAMLLYLDNARNAVNRLNENHARELLELHTLGVDSGYSQADVQELARVLTGLGVNLKADAAPPKLPPARAGEYVREGLFEFHPARHDYGAKTLLGQPIRARGLAEVDEALDRLARAPATARLVSRKLAVYMVADEPPKALVERMAAVFRRSDGDIAAVLQAMFESPEFAASLGRKFRDPMHYAIAGVRLAYGTRVVRDVNPLLGWIDRMGQPLYGHETPDGYAMVRNAWASAGQMSTRFEIARALGGSGAVLFREAPGAPLEKPPYPPLSGSPMARTLEPSLGPDTRTALAQAKSPPDWHTFLLASPERMYR